MPKAAYERPKTERKDCLQDFYQGSRNREFEARSGVLIDRSFDHRQIDQTKQYRAEEGSEHSDKKTGGQGFNRAYPVCWDRLLVSLSLKLEQHGILTVTRE